MKGATTATTRAAARNATELAPPPPRLQIETPYGPAVQSAEPAAVAARTAVEEGSTIWRQGTTGRSQAAEGQFWALEHPGTPGYGDRYGIPPANLERRDFIESAVVPPGTPFITRPAPPTPGANGGGIEVVVGPSSVKMCGFSYGDHC